MKPQSTRIILPFTFVLLLLSLDGIALAYPQEKFLQCLSLPEVAYTQNQSSYLSILNFAKPNFIFFAPTYPKPKVIITPSEVSQIQATLKCAQKHGLRIRVRSGGHDPEGLSYHGEEPFVMIDLENLRSIQVDAEKKTAWVEAGATIGELYHRIGVTSKNLGFPAGVCPTVGVGGHLSGGGYGYIMRKYGLSADQVIDAHLIDVKGRILDRKSMGEDLFWALHGGGAASFGIVVAWKVNLVPVPSNVTVFTVAKTMEQDATNIFHKWQYVADKLPEELTFSASFAVQNSSIVALFSSLFLGGVDSLLNLMEESFPELGLKKEDCMELSWLESNVYFGGGFLARDSLNLETLLHRNYSKSFWKMRADFVTEPVPVKGLEGIYGFLREQGGENLQVVAFPYGGKMAEIPESAIPFPHRAGNIYHLMYYADWRSGEESERELNLITRLYNYMTPYVSKNPRATYLNVRDLEIGRNNKGYTSVKEASIWGKKYFKNNFDKLVDVKTEVDPGNYFRNEQSIPPSSSWSDKDL